MPENETLHLTPTQVTLQFPPAAERGLQALGADVVGVTAALLKSAGYDVVGVTLHVTRLQVLDTHKAWFQGEVADIYPIFLLITGPSATPLQWGSFSMYNDIHPGDSVPIDPHAPPTILRSLSSMPTYMDLHVVVMRSRERARRFGEALAATLASDAGKKLLLTVQTAVSAANPVAGVAVTAGKELLELLSGYLSNQRDRQIFYAAASFENAEDLGIGLTHTLEDRNCVVELVVKPVLKRPAAG